MCKTSYLAMNDDGMPYVVPLSYGYEYDGVNLTLYFHCAKEGRKLDILHKNNAVSFALSNEGEPIYAKESPCNSGYYYSSIIGFGNVEFIEDTSIKCKALSAIVKHQSGYDHVFNKEQADSVCVFRVVTDQFTAKRKVNLIRK